MLHKYDSLMKESGTNAMYSIKAQVWPKSGLPGNDV